MDKEIVVFKKNCFEGEATSDFDMPYKLEVWKPGIFRYLPPNKSLKYILYWLFHFGGVFNNGCYSAYLLYSNNELVSSCLIIPSYFKWVFMGQKDVQFTYVMTESKYKGMGIAGKLIEKAIADLNHKVDAFWYITDTGNPASIKVAEKMGFDLFGKAERTGVFKKLRIKSSKIH